MDLIRRGIRYTRDRYRRQTATPHRHGGRKVEDVGGGVDVVDKPQRELPPAAVVEIIERRQPDGSVHNPGGLIIPTDVRINGASVLVPEQPCIIHEVKPEANDAVTVTLTLYAKRVFIGHEDDLPPSEWRPTEEAMARIAEQAAALVEQRAAGATKEH